MPSIPYTYLLEWTKFNKGYIGARWAKGCSPEDLWSKYFTSSKYVKEFVACNGAPDIILIDKVFATGKQALEREEFLLRKYDAARNPLFLNKAISGQYDTNDPEIKAKISRALTGLRHSEVTKLKMRNKPPASEETRKKISLAGKGHSVSTETRRKIGLAKKGQLHSAAAKLRISQANKGRKLSDEAVEKMKNREFSLETREKISRSNKGRLVSLETREKIKDTLLGHRHSEETKQKMKGRKVSEETRRKMSLIFKGRTHTTSEETKNKIRLAHQGKKQVLIKCPFCEKEGGSSSMGRYHFNNCKMAKSQGLT